VLTRRGAAPVPKLGCGAWDSVSEEALTSLLTQAFSERLQMVVDAASNSGNQDVSEKLLKLDVTERERTPAGA